MITKMSDGTQSMWLYGAISDEALEIAPIPGADTGFPVGGGAHPWGGANIQICRVFPKNCMKLRKFWSVGGGGTGRGSPPLDPPLNTVSPESKFRQIM